MGGVSSREDGVYFENREEYSRWTLASVRKAFGRFSSMKAKKAAAADASAAAKSRFLVNKREFWETFTDYTIISNGAFLSLPMDHFNIYVTNDPEHIFVMEPFVLLALFCDGLQNEKIDFCFTLFDFGNKGVLHKSDMLILMQAVTHAAHNIGVSSRTPTIQELQHLAQVAFRRADVNGNMTVDHEEFLSWANSHFKSKELLDAFTSTKEFDMASLKAKKEAQNRAEAEKPQMTKSPDLPKPKPKLQSTAEAMHGSVLVNMGRVKMAAKRTRANKLRVIATQKVLRELAQKTKFSFVELTNLQKEFASASTAVGRLTLPLFQSMLEAYFPTLAADSDMLKRMYQVIDVNEDGELDFREFVLALSKMMRGTLDEKLELVFQLYDMNGDGSISVIELARLVKHGTEEVEAMLGFAHEVMQSLDMDGDDSITRQEFATALARDSATMEVFQTCISTITLEMRMRLHQLRESNTKFTFQNLNKAFLRIREEDRRQLSQPLNLESFRQFVVDSFHADLDDLGQRSLVDFAFKSFSEVSSQVLLRDVINGFAQVLATTKTEQASFFFDFFDTDASNTLDSAEVLRMLLESVSAVNKGATRLLNALYGLDEDSDGHITLEEFKMHSLRDKLITGAMARLLGATTQSQFSPQGRRTSLAAAAVEENPFMMRPATFYMTRDVAGAPRPLDPAPSQDAGAHKLPPITEAAGYTLGTRLKEAKHEQSASAKSLTQKSSMLQSFHQQTLQARPIPIDTVLEHDWTVIEEDHADSDDDEPGQDGEARSHSPSTPHWRSGGAGAGAGAGVGHSVSPVGSPEMLSGGLHSDSPRGGRRKPKRAMTRYSTATNSSSSLRSAGSRNGSSMRMNGGAANGRHSASAAVGLRRKQTANGSQRLGASGGSRPSSAPMHGHGSRSRMRSNGRGTPAHMAASNDYAARLQSVKDRNAHITEMSNRAINASRRSRVNAVKRRAKAMRRGHSR